LLGYKGFLIIDYALTQTSLGDYYILGSGVNDKDAKDGKTISEIKTYLENAINYTMSLCPKVPIRLKDLSI
jgi:hypothetical protein